VTDQPEGPEQRVRLDAQDLRQACLIHARGRGRRHHVLGLAAGPALLDDPVDRGTWLPGNALFS